jgi:phosphoribosylanthranilate isomerase
MTGIKICGITETTGLQACLDLQVERIGLMFAPQSPRCLTMKTAPDLAEMARDKTAIVAVLVNPGDKLLKRVVDAVKPDFLQLHGRETPERVRSIWKRLHIPVIKAFAIATQKDIMDTERFSHTAAEFLFDAKPPRGSAQSGGHGAVFDWQLLTDVKPARPWLLAGGLNCDNVQTAIKVTHANMIDLSSGVESAPGVKDPQLLAKLVGQVREHGKET